MSEEKLMTEKESMELITSNNFGERGLLYLIWGWVILFCCTTTFIGTYFFNYPKISFVWLVVYLVLIFQILYVRKARRSSMTKTYTGEINAFVWIVFSICMVLVNFICLVFKMKYEFIDPLLLVLYGMPTFLSGIILKFQPLIIGAIFCWVLRQYLLFSMLNIIFCLLPRLL